MPTIHPCGLVFCKVIPQALFSSGDDAVCPVCRVLENTCVFNQPHELAIRLGLDSTTVSLKQMYRSYVSDLRREESGKTRLLHPGYPDQGDDMDSEQKTPGYGSLCGGDVCNECFAFGYGLNMKKDEAKERCALLHKFLLEYVSLTDMLPEYPRERYIHGPPALPYTFYSTPNVEENSTRLCITNLSTKSTAGDHKFTVSQMEAALVMLSDYELLPKRKYKKAAQEQMFVLIPLCYELLVHIKELILKTALPTWEEPQPQPPAEQPPTAPTVVLPAEPVPAPKATPAPKPAIQRTAPPAVTTPKSEDRALNAFDPLVYTKNSAHGEWFPAKTSEVQRAIAAVKQRANPPKKGFSQPWTKLVPRPVGKTLTGAPRELGFGKTEKCYSFYGQERKSGLVDLYQLTGVSVQLPSGERICVRTAEEAVVQRSEEEMQVRFPPVQDLKQKKPPKKVRSPPRSQLRTHGEIVAEAEKKEYRTYLPCELGTTYNEFYEGLPRVEMEEVAENSVTQEENTTFVDQRETVADQGYITTQKEPNLQDVSMQESQWHVRDVMRKPLVLKNFAWSTGQEQYRELFSAVVPGACFKGPHENLVKSFVYWRGHPRFRLQVNATKFHMGRLMMVFIPLADTKNYTNYLWSVDNLTSFPHVMLDASEGNSGVLDIPFVHMFSYFTSVEERRWDKLGSIKVFVFNSLRVAQAASKIVDCTLWVHWDNCELHQPCELHDVQMPKTEAGVEGLVKGIAQANPFSLPNLTKTVGNISGMTSNCDKPTNPLEINRWVPNVVSSLNFGDGIDMSNRLSLQNGTYTVGDSDLISTTKDDTNLLEIMKIPTRLQTYSWPTQTESEARIFEIPVTPCNVGAVTYNVAVSDGRVDVMEPTLLAYVSRTFKFWRGSLRFKIQVIASSMHSGRLQFAFAPISRFKTFDQSNYVNTYIMDLKERHEIEFVIPYMSERPWKRCDKLIPLIQTESERDGNYKTGWLNCHILNRLTAPDSVSQSVDINIFVSAGDDYEVAFITDLAYFKATGSPVDFKKSKARVEMNAEASVTTRTDESSLTLTKGGGLLSSSATSTMGENAMDLKTVLRRYYKVYETTGDISHYTLMSFENRPELSGVNKTFGDYRNQYRTPLNHFAELFTFWRGSLRYKLMLESFVNGTAITVRVYHLPGVYTNDRFAPINYTQAEELLMGSMENGGVMLANERIQGSMEFEVPFYTSKTQLQTWGKPDSTNTTGSILILMNSPFTETHAHFTLYQAAGDDFAFNYLRSAPKVCIDAGWETLRDLSDTAEWIYKGKKPFPEDDIDPSKWGPLATCPKPVLKRVEMMRLLHNATDTVLSPVREARDGFRALVGAAESVRTTCDSVTDGMNSIGLTARVPPGDGTTGSPIQLALSVLASQLQALPSQVGLAARITSWTVTIATLVSGFNSFLQASSLIVKACALVSIVAELLGSALKCVEEKLMTVAISFLNIVNGSNQGNQLPRVQMDVCTFIPALIATLVVGLSVLGFNAIPSDKETMGLLTNLNNKLRAFNGLSLALQNVKKVWETVNDLVNTGIDYILGLFAPQILSQIKLERGFDDVVEFARKIDELKQTPYQERAKIDEDFVLEVGRLADQAQKYNLLLISGKIGREANVLREYCKEALKINQEVKISKTNLPFRIDPWCVCIYGETNLGKSAIASDIVFKIMDALNYPRLNRWCPVNPTDEYFSESYDNQYAIGIDDLGTFETEEQWKHFHFLHSNQELPLVLAFNKGKRFNSHFIATSTNVAYPAPNCMLDIAAIQRRRDLLVEARWIDPENQRKTENNDNLEFRVLPSIENKLRGVRDNRTHPITGWMSYEMLVEYAIAAARDHIEAQKIFVRQTLEKKGYSIPPELQPRAEHRILRPSRAVDCEKVKAHTYLNLITTEEDEEFLMSLEWHHSEAVPNFGYYLPPGYNLARDGDGVAAERFELLTMDAEALGHDVQKLLYECSYTQILQTGLDTIKHGIGKLQQLRDYLKKVYESYAEEYPWLRIMETWPAKLAAALAAGSLLLYTASKVIHKCVCLTIRAFGYRCSKCGRWPKKEEITDKAWLLAQWTEMYGKAEEYEDGRITTLEEENALEEALGTGESLKQPRRGTREAHMGPYGTNTPGAKLCRVVPHKGGAYEKETLGLKTTKVFAHTGADRLETLIDRRVAPATYRIRGVQSGVVFTMNAVAVGGRRIALPKHFWNVVEEFQLFHSGAWVSFDKRGLDHHVFENKDIVIAELPVQFHLHKDLTKHFVSEADLRHLQRFDGHLVCQREAGSYSVLECKGIQAIDKVEYIDDHNDILYKSRSCWKYPISVGAGTCGSLLVTNNNKVSGQILGFHVAGDGTFGWSQLITREMLEPFVGEGRLGTPLPAVTEFETSMKPEGHFGLVGRVAPGRGVHQTAKSTIIPTAIHGDITAPVTQPSVLHSKDPRLSKPTNVMRKAFEKYGQAPIDFDPQHVQMVFEDLEAEIDTWTIQRLPQVLTKEEAVLGCPEYEGFDRLPMNTSPGWPWCLTRPAGELGKQYLFDAVTGKIKSQELQRALDQRETMAKRGERVESVWTCCLKDERRPHEKIASGSTRMFSIPPVDLSLLTRMYTLDFSIAIKDNRHTSFTQVGIDPQSLEWTHLRQRMDAFSPHIVAGDFTRFDGTLPPQITKKFYEHCDSFYRKRGWWCPEDEKVRMILCDEAIHSVHIVNRDIIINHTGNESGDPNTVNKNSFANYYYLALSFLGLAAKHDPSMLNMAAFRQQVLPFVYGDDNALPIKPTVLDWYNQETIAEFLLKYGIVYTNESKTGITKFSNINDIAFLKNKFGWHEEFTDIAVPLMSANTIHELLNWTREAPDQQELLKDNINDALRFAYFYGRKFFEELRTKIVSALKNKQIKIQPMTYLDFHFWFMFVIGKLPARIKQTESGFFEYVAEHGNGLLSRAFQKTLSPVYKVISWTGAMRSSEKIERTDSRYAIAIPSGEGKSWLCKKYPEVFVDHDEILLPAARKILSTHGISLKALNTMFDLEFPESDRRILLCHHPNNTRRQIIGTYALPKPAYIRANLYQRLRLPKDTCYLDRDSRNKLIFEKVAALEPSLATFLGFNGNGSCLPWPAGSSLTEAMSQSPTGPKPTQPLALIGRRL
ncbi:MAG: capsid protein [Fushun diaea subdola dicistro-like virus 2]|nr:MAG: capsid protein [Fushun diaea subdola dicistro-like virus 2]